MQAPVTNCGRGALGAELGSWAAEGLSERHPSRCLQQTNWAPEALIKPAAAGRLAAVPSRVGSLLLSPPPASPGSAGPENKSAPAVAAQTADANACCLAYWAAPGTPAHRDRAGLAPLPYPHRPEAFTQSAQHLSPIFIGAEARRVQTGVRCRPRVQALKGINESWIYLSNLMAKSAFKANVRLSLGLKIRRLQGRGSGPRRPLHGTEAAAPSQSRICVQIRPGLAQAHSQPAGWPGGRWRPEQLSLGGSLRPAGLLLTVLFAEREPKGVLGIQEDDRRERPNKQTNR